jgi:hypothetical protein
MHPRIMAPHILQHDNVPKADYNHEAPHNVEIYLYQLVLKGFVQVAGPHFFTQVVLAQCLALHGCDRHIIVFIQWCHVGFNVEDLCTKVEEQKLRRVCCAKKMNAGM